MALSIYSILADSRTLTLRVEITQADEAPLVHTLFQDVLHARLGVRVALSEPSPESGTESSSSSYGFPLGTPFELSYDAKARQVSLALGPVPGTSPAEPAPGWPRSVASSWPTGPLPNFFDLAFTHRPHR